MNFYLGTYTPTNSKDEQGIINCIYRGLTTKRVDTLLNPSTSGVVEANHWYTILHSLVHDFT